MIQILRPTIAVAGLLAVETWQGQGLDAFQWITAATLLGATLLTSLDSLRPYTDAVGWVSLGGWFLASDLTLNSWQGMPWMLATVLLGILSIYRRNTHAPAGRGGTSWLLPTVAALGMVLVAGTPMVMRTGAAVAVQDGLDAAGAAVRVIAVLLAGGLAVVIPRILMERSDRHA